MKDELTRLHWHETSEGYIYNLGKTNKRRQKKEQEAEFSAYQFMISRIEEASHSSAGRR
jgi:hypothetical protein